MIKKLSKCFYLCLSKLFNFNFNSMAANSIHVELSKYGLFAFENRLLFRLMTFTNRLVFNLTNRLVAPKALTDLVRPNIMRQGLLNTNITDHNLRNKHDLDVAASGSKFGDMTFGFIFSKLINLTCSEFVYVKPLEFVTKARSQICYILGILEEAIIKQILLP